MRKEQEQLAAEVEVMRARRDFSEAYASKVAAIGAIEDELNSKDGIAEKRKPSDRTARLPLAGIRLNLPKH